MVTKIGFCALLLAAMFLASPLATVSSDSSFHYHGTLVDEEGAPIAGADVRIVDQASFRVGTGTGLYVATYATAADGSFSFNLDWGTYELTFSKEGYTSQSVKYTGVNVPDIDVGTVALKRNVAVSVGTAAVVAKPGSRVSVPIQLVNGGSSEETVDIAVASDAGWAAFVEDDAGEVRTLTLRAGSTTSLNLVINVPIDQGSGVVGLVVSGHATVTRTLTVYAEGEPEGVASCIYPSKTASPGCTVNYKLTILNPTSEGTVASLSASGVPEGWGAYILNDAGEEIDSVNIAAGSSAAVTLSVDVPQGAEVGSEHDIAFSASLGGRSSRVALTLRVGHGASTLDLSSKYPSQSIQLGVATVYPLTLKTGASGELVQLGAEGVPEGWSVAFKTQDGRQINSVLMDADSTESINVAVTPSLSSERGVYNFTITASGEAVEGKLMLTADVVGSYSLTMGLDSLYLQTTAQASEVVSVTVTNKGYSPLTNVVLDVSYPDGWTVEYTPLKVTTLDPNKSATFLLTISVPTGAAPKDYLVTVQATSGEASAAEQTVRVTVSVESSWTIYGLALLVAAAGAFVLLYRRLRRR